MAWFNFLKNKNSISEAKEIFKNVTRSTENDAAGEGKSTQEVLGAPGSVGIGSFSKFYSNYLDKEIESEISRIAEYRRMATYPEIADVIEDAVIESILEDDEGKTLRLVIKDPELYENVNIVDNLNSEFEKLFYDRLNINDIIYDMVRSYYIDGKVYYERVVSDEKPEEGILSLKKLPTETMDFIYNSNNGKILRFIQYIGNKSFNSVNNLQDLNEIKNDNNFIIFYPLQIGYINTGVYNQTKKQVLGFLEKAKIAYNQLKLLETSVIIYRVIRSPERFVFKIDVSGMPRDKAMDFVEKVKRNYTTKKSFDPSTGSLTNEAEVFNILENFYLPINSSGGGSSIETIGGNANGFKEINDIYYFQKKLYKALKYPMSRVELQQTGERTGEIKFSGSSFGEISRDEIKWSKFLEKNMEKFCNEFRDLFLLHLQFKGIAQQYGLTRSSIKLEILSPNNYKQQMEQIYLSTRFSNYSSLADKLEFSKYWLMKEFLKLSDDQIEANYQGFRKDRMFKEKYGVPTEGMQPGLGGGMMEPGLGGGLEGLPGEFGQGGNELITNPPTPTGELGNEPPKEASTSSKFTPAPPNEGPGV